MGTKEYLKVMRTIAKPWLDENYEGQEYVWHQGSATSHRSKVILKWADVTEDSIKK